jgi:hypothetical protein
MSAALLALVIIFAIATAGFLFHKSNLDTTYKRVKELSAGLSSEKNEKNEDDAKKKSMMDMKRNFLVFLYIPQGSTFNALAISGWILFVTGVFFSFFLTPQISEEWTYLNIPTLTSSSMGFLYFGILAMLAGVIIVTALKLPDVYSMYVISRNVKIMIMAAWLLLFLPVSIPVYLATIYPYPESMSNWIDISFIILVVSQILLLSPIYIKALGVKV